MDMGEQAVVDLATFPLDHGVGEGYGVWVDQHKRGQLLGQINSEDCL